MVFEGDDVLLRIIPVGDDISYVVSITKNY